MSTTIIPSHHLAVASTSPGHFGVLTVPTERPGPGEVLVKVARASMIAFDTYVTDLGFHNDTWPMVMGFNAAGVVAAVAPDVQDLHVGDRVTAFAYQGSRSKAMQEYTIQPVTVCAKIPDNLSFAEAATIPDNFVTAFYTLFNQLQLSFPRADTSSYAPEKAREPIFIYGSGSTTGQYAIQLLCWAGYKRIFTAASPKHHEYLRTLGATDLFDYNSPRLAHEIAERVGGNSKVKYVVDCIAARATLARIAEFVDPEGKVAELLPVKEGSNVRGPEGAAMYLGVPPNSPLPEGTEFIGVRTMLYQKDEFLRDNLMPRILPRLLADGIIQPNHVRLLDEGSFKDRVALGLDLFRNNKVSGEKVVVSVDDSM
ncbi:GroES-like protein [Fistulina hepatica ATCC 64428]|uniref:GroES-like protein n=1 Tax=Fistulina hepatica ATCC 64428 TaxID=1128425 RepID=A0A0D7AG84_9AGAR|nr:GroES-like protein [Fistulina hepatica ATCC 64428]